MKKIFIKIISGCISYVMLIPVISSVYSNAVNVSESYDEVFTQADADSVIQYDKFKNCVNVLTENSSLFGIESDLSDAYIGTPFYMYSINDDMELSCIDNVLYYPIIDDDIEAFIIAHKNNGVVTFSCGTYFAEYMASYSSKNENYTLMTDGEGNIFALNESNEVTTLYSVEEKDISIENICNDEKLPMNISNLQIEASMAELSDYDNSVSAYAATTSYKQLTNYPKILQHGNNCWACTILAMGRHKGFNLAMTEQVISIYINANGYSGYNGQGATLLECYNTMRAIFDGYSPKLQYYKLAASQLIKNIDSDLPALIAGENTSGGIGHMVSLIGYYKYSDGTLAGYFIMNSQNASVQYCEFGADSYFDDVNGATQYRWTGTITLMGYLS